VEKMTTILATKTTVILTQVADVLKRFSWNKLVRLSLANVYSQA
jgi:hypothetical protein